MTIYGIEGYYDYCKTCNLLLKDDHEFIDHAEQLRHNVVVLTADGLLELLIK